MDGYVVELQNWLAGMLNWHRDCRRYGAADLARRAHGFVPGRLPNLFSRNEGFMERSWGVVSPVG